LKKDAASVTDSRLVRPSRNRQRSLATLLAMLSGILLAPASHADQSLLDKGRHALETRCSRCHAIEAEGESPHRAAPPFRAIVKRYAPENLEEALAEGIVSGHPDMPEYVLAPEEITAVVAYLESLIKPGE
jgi:mono/diheme cytochrome c family protein